MTRRPPFLWILVTAMVGSLLALPAVAAPPDASEFASRPGGELFGRGQQTSGPSALPDGFQESTVWSGFTNPTAIRFAPNGEVFVAEKSGIVKRFDSVSDPTPATFADLRTNVYNFWDRGLLGLAVDPGYPAEPYVYVLYAHDAVIGGVAPLWGTPGVTSDPCPSPPGPTSDGCVVSGRLSRVESIGGTAGPEQVLIEDWCQQYPSHSVGDLAFGEDGALYVSGGEGASFDFIDYGQEGDPVNPCGDPGGPAPAPPSAEGGALRSQDLRTAGDPVTLDGAILRVDPDTGAAMPDNPLVGGSAGDDDRIIATGVRNPFRIAQRPGTGEVWLGDVGWSGREEIDRLLVPTDSTLENFGWPCYEGASRQIIYDRANLAICEGIYQQPGTTTGPFFWYAHSQKVVTGESCPVGSSSITGMAFYPGGPYPAQYDGALFFADYSRNCLWAMFPGAGGVPDPDTRITFVPGAAAPVDVQVGPDGNVYYADFTGGTIRRIEYFESNQPPVAAILADPTSGPAPLEVSLDGTGSTDPDPGDVLTYAWDLDGDGAHDDSAAPSLSQTFPDPGTFVVGLEVSDGEATSTDSVTIQPGNDPPAVTIDAPLPTDTWGVGQSIAFSGHASDPQDGDLGAAALSWSLVLHHCPSNCHAHPVQDWPGVASGSFNAPDHEYPSHLELTLTATDAHGLQSSAVVLLYPRTVVLTFATNPPGLELAVGSEAGAAPFDRTVIVGSANSITAPSPQSQGGTTYEFAAWSDGGAATHNITAPALPATYTATFTALLAPRVKRFTPGSGPVGTTVTITGSAFTGATSVSFNGTPSTFTVLSSSRISAVVPAGATTGRIRVTTPGGSDTSKTNFVVTTLAPRVLRLI